jgi:type IV pilus assembly protein PilC
MKFLYQARTKEGDLKSGVIEASSKEVALSLLQKLGYYVTYLEEEKPPIYAREVRIFQKVSLKDLFVFSRQLSIMLSSKVPIVEALITLTAQIKNPEFKEAISDVAKEVEAGSTLSKALSKYPKIFPQFYIAMVKAGEASGKLSQSFNFLANHLEREYAVSGKIKGALIYPSLVLVVFLVVFGLMIFSILPSFEKIFAESNVEIPLVTRIILSFSRILREKFLILILILGIPLILIFSFSRTKEGKRFFDEISLKIPFFGRIFKQSLLARFAGNLSTLLSAGVAVTEALEIVEEVVGNETYRAAISKIKEGVKKGESISTLSLFYPELFPPIFNQVILVGEKTGTLSSSLSSISEFYQKEAEKLIEDFLRILEPLLIIILGGLVGGLMYSVLVPLYRLMGGY